MTTLSEQARLPMVLPHSADLLHKIGNDKVPLDKLASAIQMDPVLSAKLLRVANSPFFGMSGRIYSLEEALVVIGLSNTRAYVQAEILRSMIEQPPWDKVDLQLFGRHALWLASAAYVLANRTAVSPPLAFSAGLFHNFGRLVLLEHYPDAYAPTFQEPCCGLALAQYEQAHFHVDHGQLGAEVLGSWKLPESLVQAVLLQYHPEDPSNSNWMVSTLQTAHALHAHWSDHGQGQGQGQDQPAPRGGGDDEQELSQILSPLQQEWFRLKPRDMDGLRNDIDIKFRNMMMMVEHGNTHIAN